MAHARWQFWIDVGGTFTDCIAVPPADGLRRHKVLSSGVTKGSVGEGSTATRIVDLTRSDDPDAFWDAFRLDLLDERGQRVATSRVGRFQSKVGTLELTTPLDTAPLPGQTYELSAELEAPILAVRYMMQLPLDRPIPPVDVRLGTTRGTNALITRRGAPTALVTTAGFGDILQIGYQNRPRLFELDIRKPQPLLIDVAEIDERIAADGQVLRAPVASQIDEALGRLRRGGVESLAVCLLNAYANDAHEQLVLEAARRVGFEEISLSSEVAPLIKLVSRGDTTVVDAYLNPVLRSYVGRLRAALDAGGQSDLRILTSAGGLVGSEQFVGKDSILSGPAGGVVGFSRVAAAAGFEQAIGFDMGGTSTDVSRFDGRFEMEYETEKAGVRVVAPMMAIETVAAGGGSICHFDGVKLVVGPDSAGADPGPACYGRGGPLTVTDLNFILGKIPLDRFPFPLDRAAVERRLDALRREIEQAGGHRFDRVQLADGLLRVANANMVRAIRNVSVAKGCDPRQYAMVAFGGAAPQHACAVARELGIRRILNHPDAGVLSAYGMGLADVTRHRVTSVLAEFSDAEVERLDEAFGTMIEAARREIVAEGVPNEQIDVRRSLDLRYRGIDAPLTVAEPASGDYAAAYAREHEKLYGYVHEGRPLEIVAARVELVGRTSQQLPAAKPMPPQRPDPQRTATAWFDAQPCETAVFLRERLAPGDVIDGPAIVLERVSTTVVDPGWQAAVLSDGQLLLTDLAADEHVEVSREADPVMLEVFNNLLTGVAEQMGITLRNTAGSVNVKERLDFSCAVFTPNGDLVVNAPHIPVHLGAMSETVRRVAAELAPIRSGDVLVTNDPYRGGSHLPDVTVITPVHHADTGQLLFFTASRAHHAEIGGCVPGSMPPRSRNLAEEGVLIRPMKLVDAGRSQLDRLRSLLLAGPHPTRNVADNLADVTAQIAANNRGARDLLRLIDRFSLPVVTAYMRHIQQAAETKMRAALRRVPDGTYRYVDHLDDGSPIAVQVAIHDDSATIDFTGTSGVVEGNCNANPAIVTAAVMYCLRCLIDEDIPLNQGVLAPVELTIPRGLLHPPEHDDPQRCAAVVGGNIETSQRIVDVLLGALGLAAASQGTMNNLVFGNATFGYYETICGGAGATPQADGADAVHTHMTNTRLTDPEVLERNYPLRVRRFAVRRGSGGVGRQRGGDGVVRELEFLAPLEVSILAQRRGDYPPFGLAGGQPGNLGRNTLRRADGSQTALPGQITFAVQQGDVLTIETPGGGGYGEP